MRHLTWLPYLLAFALPTATLAFLLTIPNGWRVVLPLALLAAGFGALDRIGAAPASPPQRGAPFDLLLIALVVLQLANLGLFVRSVGAHASEWETAVAVLLMGATTAYSAIVVAHELIHRRSRFLRFVGRLLLWGGLYDHFYVEHLRGHHVRLATGTDTAPARTDETFWRFARRSLPGELASAWRISPGQVAFGVAAQVALSLLIAWAVGPRAVAALVAQAAVSGLLIAAVNYFQHFGVRPEPRRMTAADAWDCDSPFTHYSLLGISRHADHHLKAGHHYSELRPTDGSPKLPHGYLRMVVLVLFQSERVRGLLIAELLRREAPKVSAHRCSDVALSCFDRVAIAERPRAESGR